MADPITMFTVGTSALSMVGGLMKAQGAADGAAAQSDAAMRAATIGKIQADQTDIKMRSDLAGTLANIDAVRASANTDSTSPTQAAIENRFSAQSDQARQQRITNINQQVSSDESAAEFYRNQGDNAMTGGILGALGDLSSGLGGAYKSYKS